MKTKHKKRKMAAFLTAVLLTALCLCQAVFAADTAGIDPTRQASLHIDLKEVGTTTTDKTAVIAVYHVGEWDGTKGQYTLTERFAGSGADIDSLETADDVRNASRILDAYAASRNLAETAKQTTSNGEATFTDLSTGLYLVCQRRGDSDNVTVSPFLTTLPVLDEETDTWNYTVNCYPKSQADTPDTPDNPGSGGGGGSNGGGGGGRTDLTDPGTTTIINEGSVPQGGLDGGEGEDPILIEEEGVPLFALPKTGDDSATYGMLIGIMVLAAAGGVLMLWKRKEISGN